MQIAAGAAGPRRHAHAETVGRLQLRTVGAHVADAGFGIAGDAQCGGEVGRRIVARRRNRDRQQFEAAVRSAQRIARDDDLLTGRGAHDHRGNWIGDRLHPGVADLLDRPPHADGVDPRRGRQRADRDRNIVAAALAVDHVGEKESAPRVFGESALELPADQGMQLAVLVDGAVDAQQQAFGFEPSQMLLEIERGSARFGSGRLGCALIEHDVICWPSDARR